MVPPAVTDEFSEGLLLTRLAPPAQQLRLLRRPRVEGLLAAAMEHPLCVLLAPAGGGKTTALAALAAHGGWPVAWLRASSGDEPNTLLRHLVAAFRPIARLDETRIAAVLARSGDPLLALEALVNELAAALDDDTLLVIDQYQLADARPELRVLVERLSAAQPLRLHIALATRVEPELLAVATARVRGELLAIGREQLAFNAEEAGALFALAGREPPAALAELIALGRGWPLGVQAALHADDWRNALGLREAGPLDQYLAHEVLAELPAPLQRFLLQTCGLEQLDPALCAMLLDNASPTPWLAELGRRALFVERDATGLLRLEPVFQAFLERRARVELAEWPALQRRIAAVYRAKGDVEGLLRHLLLAGDHVGAASALVEFAVPTLAAGQAERLLEWVRRLPPAARAGPRLLEVQAAALRKLGRYAEALHTEAAAETAHAAAGDLDGQVRTLRGQAEVYLDTVQPMLATELLKRALKLLPRERVAERAELLRLQAENWANRGRADVALVLEAAASAQEAGGARRGVGGRIADGAQPPAASLPSPRLLLRAGRLNEARQQLEAQLWNESQPGANGIRPRAHREPLLLLALIYAMLGSGTRALAMARRGLAEAQQRNSALTEAIAELRLGHAYQLAAPSDPAPALQRYGAAFSLIQAVGVGRTRAEGCMGLTLLHGHAGDLLRAEADAREGLQLAAAAGDEWSAALIWLALGGAAAAGDDPRAAAWLAQAQQRFARGGDQYGQALVSLWRAIVALRAGELAGADVALSHLLDAVSAQGYTGVLVAPSLFGPRDMASVVPLLLRARTRPEHGELARQLLRQGFPTIAADDTVDDYYPGYTLRVQMLGTFRVWRGSQEIQAREWQREKARQLFQLLLTHRGHWLQREQICAWLWPEADLDAAERQFKVTLNALNTALEPARPPRIAPFFIRRQGLAYSFAPSYGVWIDVDEFELRAAAAVASNDPDVARRNAQIAVQLYRGDYLAEALYDAWSIEERERLLARFLAGAVAYAARLSAEGDQAQAVQLCEQVLRRDRCYEEAYQLLMRAHGRAGSRSQALRSYSRCVQALRDELAIEPLPETDALYEQIKRNQPV